MLLGELSGRAQDDGPVGVAQEAVLQLPGVDELGHELGRPGLRPGDLECVGANGSRRAVGRWGLRSLRSGMNSGNCI